MHAHSRYITLKYSKKKKQGLQDQMKMDYLELRMKREVTEQDLVRWAGRVTATTALVPFP